LLAVIDYEEIMDWVLYVFKKGTRSYLVPDESLSSAWVNLAKRQSMSVENCKKQYKYEGHMNGNSHIRKI